MLSAARIILFRQIVLLSSANKTLQRTVSGSSRVLMCSTTSLFASRYWGIPQLEQPWPGPGIDFGTIANTN